MIRFVSYRWYIHLVLLTVIAQNTRGFSLNSRRSRSANENVEFQPTPNLGKMKQFQFAFVVWKWLISNFTLIVSAFFSVNPNFFKKCDPCALGIRCVPAIQCPAHVRMGTLGKPQICDLPHGGHGYCCTTGRNFTNRGKKINFHTFFPLLKIGWLHLMYFIHLFDIKKDEKHQRSASKGRNAASDLSNNLIKIISSAIEEANDHLLELNSQEPEVAVINKQNQPDFMHNLVFR